MISYFSTFEYYSGYQTYTYNMNSNYSYLNTTMNFNNNNYYMSFGYLFE